MRGTSTKKTHHPHTGVRWPFCPERIPHAARSGVPQRNLVDTVDYRHHRHRRQFPLSPVETKPLGLKGESAMKKRKNRSHIRDNIRVVPVFKEKPDIEKLGKAVIAMAEELANQAKAEKEGEHDKIA